MVLVACKCLNINITATGMDGKAFPEKEEDNSPIREKWCGIPPFTNGGIPHIIQQKKVSAPGDSVVAANFQVQLQSFLKESIGPVTQLLIETKHPELTLSCHVQLGTTPGQVWALTQCTICDQLVYGSRKDQDEEGPIEVVLNGQLLTTGEAINALRADEHYSRIFKVIIRTTPKDNACSRSLDLLNADPKLKNLHGLLNDRLRKETERTEELIRQYTAEQFLSLRIVRQAAELEFNHLAQRLRVSDQTNPPNNLSDRKLISVSVVGGALLETPPLTPDSGHDNDMGHSPPHLHLSSSSSSRSLTISDRSTSAPKKKSVSAVEDDCDDLFGQDVFFPGGCTLDHGPPESEPEDEEDDDSDEAQEATEALHSGRYGYGGADQSILGKSLPIAMQARVAQEEANADPNDDNVDIAASIKALAKSIHGEAIFGDLPRPRIGTQI